jgi:hypothetical protein
LKLFFDSLSKTKFNSTEIPGFISSNGSRLFDPIYFDDNNLFCTSENYWSRDLIIKNAKNSLAADQIGIVIGDSPKDILSAKASGLKNIAVTTGAHSSAELYKYGPSLILREDWQVDDLVDGIKNLTQNL